MPDRVPTAGGQYRWASMSAPSRSHKILSYVTGQYHFPCHVDGTNCQLSRVACVTGRASPFCSCQLCRIEDDPGTNVLTQPAYDPKPFHQMLIFWASTTFAVFVNILASTILPIFEGCVLLYWITGFFAVLIPLLALGQHQKTSQVLNN